jgi:hypothetical protein
MKSQDLYGLTLSTTPAAAGHYNDALGRILRVHPGADAALRAAVAADPGFALAHAALALLGHEQDAPVDVPAALRAAARWVRAGTDRERSHVAAITARVRGSVSALRTHLRAYPRDALLLGAAVPTIAFAGGSGAPRKGWELVESVAGAYGDDWWYAGMLAFVRQEQGWMPEAADLADRALAVEPTSGHAAHARTHVYYETGDHADGLAWLDAWIDSSGLGGEHRVHFSWHAALHELAVGDSAAVRRRYHHQLAPPLVGGVRLLVDSASLLWRGSLWSVWSDDAPITEVLDAVDPALLTRPPRGFMALHAGLALAVAGDAHGLGRLHRYARSAGGPIFGDVVAPLVAGLLAYVEGHFSLAADVLVPVLPRLPRLGGSAAQREVVEETVLHALLSADRFAEARTLLSRRLDRTAFLAAAA